MKFGIMFSNTGPYAEPEHAAALATAADECGLESIWAIEHVVVPEGYESQYPYHDSGQMPFSNDIALPDPLIWLTYVAAVTEQIKLATGILILPQRNPLILAKEVATLARLSNGRFELGIGVGWLEEEFNQLGVPFAQRGKRTDEMIEAMRAVWAAEGPAEFHGDFYDFSGANVFPNPPGGSVPILIGGHSKAAARRAGRLGDGFFPGNGSLDELVALREQVDAAAEEFGRDPSDIEFTAGAWSPRRGTIDQVAEMEEAGIDRLIVTPPSPNPEGIRQGMEELAEKIAPVATR